MAAYRVALRADHRRAALAARAADPAIRAAARADPAARAAPVVHVAPDRAARAAPLDPAFRLVPAIIALARRADHRALVAVPAGRSFAPQR